MFKSPRRCSEKYSRTRAQPERSALFWRLLAAGPRTSQVQDERTSAGLRRMCSHRADRLGEVGLFQGHFVSQTLQPLHQVYSARLSLAQIVDGSNAE